MADGLIDFGSVCSGIEAASVAFHPLGWRAAWYSEIEKFPCSVLACHYPETPNLGDMTLLAAAVRARTVHAPALLCGGTPCQSFSVAGLRQSLDDARGNLTLAFVELANAIDDVRADRGEPAAVVLWENVPGVLSTQDNAFGCFLAGLAGCDEPIDPGRDGWSNAGVVLGPRRAVCWRILDAQYFGLAQRRRRVFVVASARDGFDPIAVLLEPEGVRRDSPPSRETGERPAPTISARASGGGGLGTDFDCDGGLIPEVVGALTDGAHNGGGSTDRTPILAESSLPPVAMCLNAGAMGRQDSESETLIPTIGGGFDVAHSLRADGFDASEDGTGRGTPLVPVLAGAICRDSFTGGAGGRPEGAAAGHFIAFSCKDHAADAADDLAPTLRAMGHHAGSHANAVGQVAVAFHPTQDPIHSEEVCHALAANANANATVAVAFSVSENSNGFAWESDAAPTLQARDQNPTSNQFNGVRAGMAVRRLTPRECERLQGFPDDYTLIPGKPLPHVKRAKLDLDYVKYLARGGVRTFEQCMNAAADGPRYKALGHSWAVPVVAWIGRRIDAQLRSAG